MISSSSFIQFIKEKNVKITSVYDKVVTRRWTTTLNKKLATLSIRWHKMFTFFHSKAWIQSRKRIRPGKKVPDQLYPDLELLLSLTSRKRGSEHRVKIWLKGTVSRHEVGCSWHWWKDPGINKGRHWFFKFSHAPPTFKKYSNYYLLLSILCAVMRNLAGSTMLTACIYFLGNVFGLSIGLRSSRDFYSPARVSHWIGGFENSRPKQRK